MLQPNVKNTEHIIDSNCYQTFQRSHYRTTITQNSILEHTEQTKNRGKVEKVRSIGNPRDQDGLRYDRGSQSDQSRTHVSNQILTT